MSTVLVSLYVTWNWIWSHQNEISRVYFQDVYIFSFNNPLNFLIHFCSRSSSSNASSSGNSRSSCSGSHFMDIGKMLRQ